MDGVAGRSGGRSAYSARVFGVARDEVHVWLVPVARAGAVASLLDEDERARAARFRFERDRLLYTTAHGALRWLLARYVGEAPQALKFDVTELGKPYLVGGPGVTFNLSHSGELAAVAVGSAGREVGVDVEQGRMVHAEDGVAQRVMTADELARYEALAGEERRRFLLWVWARKEALVKASGQGVRESLTTLSCVPGTGEAWSVVDLDVPGYAAAVAAAGHDWSPVVRTLDDELDG